MRLLAAIVIVGLAAAQSLAQSTGSSISEAAAPPPSRWAQETEVLDQALRQRALTATQPRELWVAAQFDSSDPWARVGALARARAMAPGEMLYVASLAMGCLAPMRPLPPECDAVDRLADWAIRDADNGVPSLLLAQRARSRNNVAAMVAFLDEAAGRPRFDDYRDRGAQHLWAAVREVPGTVDPAARAVFAIALASRPSPAVGQLETLCRDPAKLADNVRSACLAAGTAAAQRGANWPLRIAGARLAGRNGEISRRAFECAEAGSAIAEALESPDAAVRARALAAWEARLARKAQVGEVAACEGKPG
ncbi:MAG: hypothetical protein IT518_10865 [Burkholderiales bacterium]|nr:hypothetical protein [Burkholderiales bacterium]